MVLDISPRNRVVHATANSGSVLVTEDTIAMMRTNSVSEVNVAMVHKIVVTGCHIPHSIVFFSTMYRTIDVTFDIPEGIILSVNLVIAIGTLSAFVGAV
jgi:hypothetical protein